MKPIVNCFLCVLLASSVLACSDSTGPSARVQLLLFNLESPSTAVEGDAVRIAFTYDRNCLPVPAIEMRSRHGEVTITVWVAHEERPEACDAIVLPAVSEMRLRPQFDAAGQVRVVFRQPGGADSVRTIHQTPVDVHEP